VTTELTAQRNQLVCLDDGILDLASRTLEHQVYQLDKEIEEAVAQYEVDSQLSGKIAHKLSFEFPEFSDQVRVLANRLAYLMGQPQLDDDIDPMSGRDRSGEMDKRVTEQNRKREAEEEQYIRDALQTHEGKVLARECKRIYRQIRAICHPDRTKDKSLHPVFDFATKRYKLWDLQALKNILGQVKNYIKLRSNNKDFQAYLANLIAKKKRDADIVKKKAEEFRASKEYEMTVIKGQSEIKAVRRAAYAEMVKIQIDMLNKKIAEIQHQRGVEEVVTNRFKPRS
jgi:hypothetical protein